jgi:DNA topoisomerase-1
VSSGHVNNFLKEIVSDVSVKMFRTAYGSLLVAENLRIDIPKNASIAEKVAIFNNVNLIVAKKLNHQKNVGKNQKEKEKEGNEKLVDKEKKLSVLRLKLSKEIELLNKQLRNLDSSISKETQKQMKDVITSKINKKKERLIKETQKIEEYKLKLNFSSETKDVALGTSKASYSSPKVVLSWCKDNEVPIEKIYTKTLIKKFEWAMDTDKDYYKKYPNVRD